MGTEANDLTADLVESSLRQYELGLPDEVADHARLLFLNALALVVAAARTPAVDAAVAVAGMTCSGGDTVVPGRAERLDEQGAALAIGVAGHLDDFDDTHLATVIHPSAASLAALLPTAQIIGASGRTVLTAFAISCEVQLRIGVAMSPSHYDAGWHITGTAGVLGTALACGLLLNLSASEISSALGIAASSTVGQRAAFGTMTKALHVGKAAANGLLASRLAAAGFTGPRSVLEANRGYFDVMAEEYHVEGIAKGFGERWELLQDVIKPYPCGVVAHPLIDAGRALRERGLHPDQIVDLRVRCNPLVPDLMGIRSPKDGLQARFSAVHGLAVGVTDEVVGLSSYSDERARDEVVDRLRRLVELVPDRTCDRDATEVRAMLADGSEVEVVVEHARGSADRPLTSDEVMLKVRDLLGRAPDVDSEAVVERVMGLPRAGSLSDLVSVLATSGANL